MVNEVYKQIPEHFDDYDWIDEHAATIYKTMREMIKDRKQVDSIIKNLLLIYPALLNRGDLRKWVKLTNRAYRKIVNMEMRRIQKQEYSSQQAYTITPVAVARAKPKKPRSERLNQREMFEVYLKLMMAYIYTQPEELALSTMQSALAFARRINDPYYSNKLYQTLAFIHLENKQFLKALNQARLAYQYWRGHPDVIEDGLTLFAIATAYRGLRDWDNAQDWLYKAADVLAKADNSRTYGIIAAETASLDIYLRRFESACQWAEIALREYQSEGMLFHVSYAYHTLGLAQAYNGQFDDAVDNLWRAINYWESVGDLSRQVHTEHSLAFAEARMGKTDRALMRLDRNRSLCRRIPNSLAKERHLKFVGMLEDAIRDGTDLLNIFTVEKEAAL